MLAQVSSIIPISKGNNHPLSDQAFQHFLLAAFERAEIEVRIFFSPCSLATVHLGYLGPF